MATYGFGPSDRAPLGQGAGQFLPADVYAYGQRTRLGGTNDLYNYAQSLVDSGKDRNEVAQQLSNNPFGISYQQLTGTLAPSATTKVGRASLTSGSGGSGGPAVADRSNSIALQLAGLGAVDSQTNTGIGSIDSALGKLKGMYGTETTANEGNYKDQSTTNQTNLQKNKQTALVNASQGRQGLFGTLASLGALNGSGIDLANRAVQKGANDDLSGAADSFGTNQTGLDTAINQYRQEDNRRNQSADTSAENARSNVRLNAATTKQKFYTQLADDYSAQGNAGDASRYAKMAGDLYPEVARQSIPDANLAYSGASFTPGSLSNYIAGADNTQVSATPMSGGSNLPGLVASTKKKQLQLV